MTFCIKTSTHSVFIHFELHITKYKITPIKFSFIYSLLCKNLSVSVHKALNIRKSINGKPDRIRKEAVVT